MPYSVGLRANLRRFYAYRFLNNLQLWLPIWVLYLQRERGLSIGQVTALDAPFWLIIVLAQVPTGAFADRFGRRAALVVGALLYGLAMLAFGLATSYLLILGSYALWGVAMAFGSGADLAFLYDALAAEGRIDDYQRVAGRAFGVTAAAGVVSLLAGARLADLTRLDTPILVSAAICLVSAGFAWRFREPPRAAHERSSFLRTVRLGGKIAWRDPRLRYMLGLSSIIQAASFAPVIFTQPFLAKYHVALSAYGVLQAPARIFSIGAAIYAYRVAHRLGERRMLVALPIWMIACMLLLAGIEHPLAFIAFPLMQLGFSAANPLLSDYLNKYIPAAQRATVLSLGQLLTALLMIGFEPLLGAVAQTWSLGATFATAAAFVAVGGSLTLLPWLARERRQTAAAASALATSDLLVGP